MSLLDFFLKFAQVDVYINKDGSYLLSRDWAGLKWHPVLKVWEQLQDEHRKETHNSYR